MQIERDWIQDQCRPMKAGQSIKIDYRLFQKAYPCGYPSIYENPEQAFLSSMVGSACGVWRVRRDIETGDYIISKHPESDKRYYIDPDRAHLFKRMPDGTLERRGEEKECENHVCHETKDLHFAYGYTFAGYFCSKHCPNKGGQEGCDYWEEHETHHIENRKGD